MKIILIITTFFILNLVISCGEEEKNTIEEKNPCENITCDEYKLTKEDFRFTCTKMLECNFGQEENLDLCMVKYYSYYHSEEGGINAYYMPIGEHIKTYIKCIDNQLECSQYSSCFDSLMENHVKIETPCDKNTFVNHCNDKGSLVYCYNDLEQEYYCPFYDKVCLEDPSPNCYLKGNTPDCDTESENETSCENGNMILCRDGKKLITSCVEHYGENFTCMNFSYPSDGFTKNTYGCFYE